jgi:energy-coupling factor transporter ATP-binding protein EcfA2
VIGLTIGLSSGYWQLALISFLMVSLMASVQIYKNRYPAFDASSSYFVSASQTAIDDRVLPRFEFLWKKQWQQILLAKFRARAAPNFLDEVLSIKTKQGAMLDYPKPLKIWLGASVDSERYLDLGLDGSHAIIVGPTGSGKSELLKLCLLSLMESSATNFALFDFKGGATLGSFKEHSIGLATDLDISSQEKLWQVVSSELATREELFATYKVSSIGQYHELGGELPALVVVVDEFAAALSSGAKAFSCIEDVTARGRSLGVHLIAATQSLTGIPRSMLTNLRVRIAMASADPIDLVQLGLSPQRTVREQVTGWALASVLSSSEPATFFYFPLGFTLARKPAASIPASEPALPVRSQWLRQRYSIQGQATDPPAAPASSPDSQLLSRMEGLR